MSAAALLTHFETALGPLPRVAVELCRQSHPIDLTKGEALLREGGHWQHLWWLERGALRLNDLDRDGQSAFDQLLYKALPEYRR